MSVVIWSIYLIILFIKTRDNIFYSKSSETCIEKNVILYYSCYIISLSEIQIATIYSCVTLLWFNISLNTQKYICKYMVVSNSIYIIKENITTKRGTFCYRGKCHYNANKYCCVIIKLCYSKFIQYWKQIYKLWFNAVQYLPLKKFTN